MKFHLRAPAILALFLSGPIPAATQAASEVDWARLPELIKQLPPPPASVADSQRYRRDVESRLDAMEQALENYERHLQRMTERLNALSDREARQSFSETERQGKAAAERLARQREADTPQARERDRREQTRMRETLPGGAGPQVATGSLNQSALAFAMQSANLQRREEQAASRLNEEWQAADSRCNDDTRCAKTEESRHLGKLTLLKNEILAGLKNPWGLLKSASVELSNKSMAAIEAVKDGGRRFGDTTGNAGKEVMGFIAQTEAVRILLGSFGLLLNSSRQQWEESSNLREQMHDLDRQSAGGTAGTR